MGKYIGYFDASGSPDHKVVMVVAGCVSTEHQWLRFERDWKSTLYTFGVSRFHMREFAHSVGEFSDWKGNRGKRDAFIKRLVKAIRTHTAKSFSVSLLLKKYREVNDRYQLSENSGVPYVLCAGMAVEKVSQWLRDRTARNQIRFVFEDGDEKKSILVDWMEKHGYAKPLFESKSIVPLQAADLIAWEHQKFVVNTEEKGGIDLDNIRKSLAELSKMKRDWTIYTEEMLLSLCIKSSIPLRATLKSSPGAV